MTTPVDCRDVMLDDRDAVLQALIDTQSHAIHTITLILRNGMGQKSTLCNYNNTIGQAITQLWEKDIVRLSKTSYGQLLQGVVIALYSEP